MSSETIQIPKRSHGVLIGPGGATVNKIKAACGSGFQIVIPKRDEASDEVKLIGTPAQIEIARKEIQALLAPKYITGQVDVPKEYHWAVIGEKGKNIQEIRTKASVHAINLPKSEDKSTTITIQGSTKEQVEKAKQMILEFVEQHHKKTVETDTLYKKYREKSQQHAENRKKYFEAATAAYNSGDKATAAELSKKGKYEHHKMLKAQNFAAMKIFKAKNKESLGRGEIDLHGLHAKEAVVIVDVYLYKFAKKGSDTVTVICGKGLHSDGAAVIKPSIIELLKTTKHRYTEEDERGAIVVSLR